MKKPSHGLIPDSFVSLSGLLSILLIFFVATPMTVLRDAVNLYVVNSFVATVVLFQGILALKIIWKLEMRAGGGSIPFAWSFLAVQHFMLGFGGLLVSVFDQDYSYANDQGSFPWNEAVLPLLFVHAVSLNVGLLGVFLATKNSLRRTRLAENYRRQTAHWNIWAWNDSRALCYVSLALHCLIWMVLIPIHTKLADSVSYVVYGLSQTANATFVLWGLSWGECRSRQVFIAYCGFFVILEMALGERGDAIFPLVLFGISYLMSPGRRRFNLRAAIRWIPWALPLALFCYWVSLSSEDMRHNFERGSLDGIADLAARVEAMLPGGAGEPIYYRIGSGDDVNGPFRLGSRIFELSAADVTSRTPDEFPFWGWSEQDTSVLWTGLAPLKLNPGAVYNTDPNAGVLFLQSYGWTYVDPTKGNSMPATLVADAWRRFGWAGVIVVFFSAFWVIAKVTIILRSSPWGAAMAVFSAAVLAYNIGSYAGEIIYLLDSTPRRLAITMAYAGLVYASSVMFGGIGSRTGRKARGAGAVAALAPG